MCRQKGVESYLQSLTGTGRGGGGWGVHCKTSGKGFKYTCLERDGKLPEPGKGIS